MSKSVKELARECCSRSESDHVLLRPPKRCPWCAEIERALIEHEKAVREECARIADKSAQDHEETRHTDDEAPSWRSHKIEEAEWIAEQIRASKPAEEPKA